MAKRKKPSTGRDAKAGQFRRESNTAKELGKRQVGEKKPTTKADGIIKKPGKRKGDDGQRDDNKEMMLGPDIIVRSMSALQIPDKHGNIWQYHPQSDRHSKIACWAVMFDLLLHCPLLRQHITSDKVCFGINHKMVDFTADRDKNLDLVISIPRAQAAAKKVKSKTFEGLSRQYEVVLNANEQAALAQLPTLYHRPVGDVLVALEAKASMTAQQRAESRLYDELTSAWQCINGSAPNAVAVGLGMVNAAPQFISPSNNKRSVKEHAPSVNFEQQPKAALGSQELVRSVKVRGHPTERGYDAVGMLTILARNDGSPITLAPEPPSVPSSDGYHYERMILRVAGLYNQRFIAI